MDPPVEIRRGAGAQWKWCQETSVLVSRETGMLGNFVGRIKADMYRFDFKTARGTSLETPSPERASSCDGGGTTWFFSSCGGILELRRGIQDVSCVVPEKSNLPFEVRGRAGDCSRITAGQIDLI